MRFAEAFKVHPIEKALGFGDWNSDFCKFIVNVLAVWCKIAW